ncbi:MAG: fumarylacetoacetate hydrolase family protein [Anaerolineae bacterium]|nr:fumarylacetoacetate hydrolase family protein [Thermoflexales bacterium]MDW8406506.1 fumarylacetoacetate hydrolase family protein [Anaerolineae bacterium]
MIVLTQHATPTGRRWAAQGYYLPPGFNLGLLLTVQRAGIHPLLHALAGAERADHPLVAPIESEQEVWACGVTYLRSRDARKAESQVGDVYQMVYEAKRPEIFFKSIGWRVVGHGKPVRVRADSAWNVPEPELTLVINCQQEIIGFTLGNDMSSRSIEGENPLYLPQAKMYNGACALGPGIVIAEPHEMRELPIYLEIVRDGKPAFQGETSLRNMKRSLEELVHYLFKEIDFPTGVFLMTGTGVVPPESFTLQSGDLVRVRTVTANGETLILENPVA